MKQNVLTTQVENGLSSEDPRVLEMRMESVTEVSGGLQVVTGDLRRDQPQAETQC